MAAQVCTGGIDWDGWVLLSKKLAFAACFQKATEVNTTKIVVKRKNKGKTRKNMGKLKIQRTENGGKGRENGRKGRENGRKGRENGGKGRTLNIEVQILPEHAQKIISFF